MAGETAQFRIAWQHRVRILAPALAVFCVILMAACDGEGDGGTTTGDIRATTLLHTATNACAWRGTLP